MSDERRGLVYCVSTQLQMEKVGDRTNLIEDVEEKRWILRGTVGPQHMAALRDSGIGLSSKL